MVVFAKRWFYSGKSECIRTKWSCSCKSSVREKWLYSGKVVVSGQSGYIRVKWL